MLMDGRKKLALPEIGSDPNRTYRLGIMGGTFDPIHYGHLVTAEQAREALGLDLVLFMPAGSPAFKLDQEVSSAEDRYAMTVLATAANEAFYTSRLEIDREGVTYTVDTLTYLREQYPSNVHLYFITGADAILDIVSWRDAGQIAELATLLAATRPGYDITQARERIEVSVRCSLHRDSRPCDQLDEYPTARGAREERPIPHFGIGDWVYSQEPSLPQER